MSRSLKSILCESLSESASPFDRGQLVSACTSAGSGLTELLDESPFLRCQLYRLLLVGTAKKEVPQSFAVHASSASDEQRAQAVELLALLARPSVPLAEAEGMLYFFAVKTGRNSAGNHDEPLKAVLLTMARAINVPEVGDDAVLPLLFTLVYQVHAKLMPSPGAEAFSGCTQEVFRLLLQYHHPALSVHFDRLQFAFGPYADAMVHSLFASNTHSNGSQTAVQATLRLWDLLFVAGDRLLSPFLVIALLLDVSTELTALATKPDLQHFFDVFVPSLAPGASSASDDVDSLRTPSAMNLGPSTSWIALLHKARLVLRTTPLTSRIKLGRLLFPDNDQLQRDAKEERGQVLGHVTLVVDVEELVNAFAATEVVAAGAKANKVPHLHFVVLDCRSESSFNFARLPTAVHVGGEIGFDATLLKGMVERFSSARGSHLCILGTGRNLLEEVNLLKVIGLHLVQSGFPFVSVADGGFKAVIPYIKKGQIEYVRTPQPPPSSSPGGASASQCLPSVGKAQAADPAPQQPQAAGGDSNKGPASNTVSLVNAEDLKRRAEDIKVKATEGIATARGWGASIFKAIADNFTSAGSTQSADLVAQRPEVELPSATVESHAQKPPSSSQPSATEQSTTSTATDAPGSGGADKSKSAPRTGDNVFSLGHLHDDEDDDDLDLFLSTATGSPPRPAVPHPSTVLLPTSASASPDKPHAETFAATPLQSGGHGPPMGEVKSPEILPPVPSSLSPGTVSTSASREKHPFDDLFT